LIVAEHSINYPLQSRKIAYFKQWYKVLLLMKDGHHLTREGFMTIISIKSGFPRG